MKPITTIIIGAGQRGRIYTDYALRNPGKLKVVGVAEPSDVLRNEFTEKHSIPAENCFASWEGVLKREKFADTVMICTQDKMHFAPAMAAIDKGYDILLEKPISPSPEECFAIADAAEKKGVRIVVCHVLRYTPFFTELKSIIDSGEIGEIASVVHNENVGDIHHSHSFVRGNWGNSDKSSPMILQKCSHDTDIMQWLIGKKCLRLSSFGSLKYFNKDNRPDGAPPRCTDGCEHDCPYDARKIYLEDITGQGKAWFRPVAAECSDPTDEQVEAALKTGPYGRCVFQCDNNVVDHQTINMEFEDGITALFSMCSFTLEGNRTIRIMGTKGEIKGNAEKNEILISNFLTRTERRIETEFVEGHIGHGGGDEGIMNTFCEYINGEYTGNAISNARVSAENHMIAFASERSRLNGGSAVEVGRG